MAEKAEPLHLRLKTTAPLFLNGATPGGSPELRAASVRGQLRYWARAISGATAYTSERTSNAESRAFGSTQLGSSFAVRFTSEKMLTIGRKPMLPHSNDRPALANAILEGQAIDLRLVQKPGTKLPPLAFNALMVWLLLGGLGKRSRRMFGGFAVLNLPTLYPNTPQEYAKAITDRLTRAIRRPSSVAIPDFPTLHPQHSAVLVGTRSFNPAEDANKALFKVLRNDNYRDNRVFGGVRPHRIASPLIAQVRQLGDGDFYPVLTVMRWDLQGADWTVMKRFLIDMQHQWGAVVAWGEDFLR